MTRSTAEIEADIAAELEFKKAKFMIPSTARGDKAAAARMERDLDPEIRRLEERLLRAKALRKMTSTVFANAERSIALTSRELTRRIGLAPAQGRQQWTSR